MLKLRIFNMTNIRIRAAWGLMCLAGILLTACAPAQEPEVAGADRLPHAVIAEQPGGVLMLNANTKAGDVLGDILLPRMGSTSGILVATMVNMEDFEKTSAFGRISMQQIGSRLSQHGFKVLEPRLASTMRFEKRGGEFMLTRESLQLLSSQYDAHAVMVGTYSESKDRVFTSVRVVRLNDNSVVAAYEYYLPKNDDVQALLGIERGKFDDGLWYKYARREQAF